MRSDKERLLDVIEAIERIEQYSSQGKEKFYRDELIKNGDSLSRGKFFPLKRKCDADLRFLIFDF